VRTLVIRFSSLGDIVLSGAVTQALGDVEYLTLARYAELAAALPGVSRVWEWETSGRQATRGFDRIIDLHNSPRSRWATALRPGPIRRVKRYDWERRSRVLFKSPPAPPVIDRYADAAGVQAAASPWMPQARGDALLLVPFAAHPTKEWPVERYAEVGRAWAGTVVLLGGPEDAAALHNLAAAIGPLTEVVAESGFVNTLTAVNRAGAAVGGDTGLTHLAAASGIKTVGIFGPTTAQDGFWSHGVEAVEEALPCRPCSRHGEQPCRVPGRPCMNQISVSAVLERLGCAS